MSAKFRPSDPLRGRPLAIDPTAKSTRSDEPAFIAPPQGTPAYYGFPVLEDVTSDGFTFGMITDFEAEPCDLGDAFIIAPDGSRAGIAWTVRGSIATLIILPPEPDRWGVWDVSFVYPMDSRENARRNLQLLVPLLKPEWERWRAEKRT